MVEMSPPSAKKKVSQYPSDRKRKCRGDTTYPSAGVQLFIFLAQTDTHVFFRAVSWRRARHVSIFKKQSRVDLYPRRSSP